MDSSSMEDWKVQVDEALVRHESEISEISAGIQQISQQLEALKLPNPKGSKTSAADHAPLHVSPPMSELLVAPPDRYAGEPGQCRAFLVQCSLIFALQPALFSSDRSRVAYVISLLSGRPLLWAAAVWEANSALVSSYERFSQVLQNFFDPVSPEKGSSIGLCRISQGSRSVRDYTIEFQTLALDSLWNEQALLDVYYLGLSDVVKDALTTQELPSSLCGLIELASKIDRRLQERRKERSRLHHPQLRKPRRVLEGSGLDAERL